MIERTWDVRWFNQLANHPAVYPWVRGPIQGPLDASELLNDCRNYCLRAGDGAFLYVAKGAGVYELHTQFPRGGAFEPAKESFAWMFGHTDCREIVTMVPAHNIKARRITLRCGFKFDRVEGEWPTDEGPVPLEHYRLSKADWQCH